MAPPHATEPPPPTASSDKSSFLEKGSQLGTEDEPAIYAEAVTQHDTVLITEHGQRLPGVPMAEAKQLNELREIAELSPDENGEAARAELSAEVLMSDPSELTKEDSHPQVQVNSAPADTQPLLPPVPLYGPPTRLRKVQLMVFRATSNVLSMAFLLVVILGAAATSIKPMVKRLWGKHWDRNVDEDRPSIAIERQRARERKERREESDPLIDDIGFYARKIGLDVREYEVTTEDGFIIPLQRIVDPQDLPETWQEEGKRRRYPVLLQHGLLQSSGSFCVNDEDSLAFFLTRVGYDVWLGNNRCHFKPKHMVLKPEDPRMWAWNIRQLGILDLPALVEGVLQRTGFPKLALIAHSQGTTQSFIALSKSQRPALASQISVFCALAPAVYASHLIDKAQFKFMRILSPSAFRLFFGICDFIPLMGFMQKHCPRKLYGSLGYRVFHFLFGWQDTNWDRALRDRFFIFSPTRLSTEAMRWWLGRDCFAAKRCVLRMEEEWYGEGMTPVALWICNNDGLVDGHALSRKLHQENNVKVVYETAIDGYEHLDVVWAMDAVEKVGRQVARVVKDVVDESGEVVKSLDCEWRKERTDLDTCGLCKKEL